MTFDQTVNTILALAMVGAWTIVSALLFGLWLLIRKRWR